MLETSMRLFSDPLATLADTEIDTSRIRLLYLDGNGFTVHGTHRFYHVALLVTDAEGHEIECAEFSCPPETLDVPLPRYRYALPARFTEANQGDFYQAIRAFGNRHAASLGIIFTPSPDSAVRLLRSAGGALSTTPCCLLHDEWLKIVEVSALLQRPLFHEDLPVHWVAFSTYDDPTLFEYVAAPDGHRNEAPLVGVHRMDRGVQQYLRELKAESNFKDAN